MAIKLKALDSFYSDDTKRVDARSTFEVESEDRAKHLVDRGLAERVGGGAAKAEPAPLNKAEAAPENKSDPAPISAEPAAKPRRGRKPKV